MRPRLTGRLVRGTGFSVCLLGAALFSARPLAQAPDSCAIAGAISASRLPLPGVVVTLIDGEGRVVDSTSSAPDGTYALKLPTHPATWTLRASLVAFAPVAREIKIESGSCAQRLDIPMTLASRAATATAPAGGTVPSRTPLAARGGGRGETQAPAGRGQQFQSLELLADQSAAARDDEAAASADSAAQVLLPPGFSPDTSAESVAAIGSTQAAAGFFGPNGPGDFTERFGGGFGDATGDGQ